MINKKTKIALIIVTALLVGLVIFRTFIMVGWVTISLSPNSSANKAKAWISNDKFKRTYQLSSTENTGLTVRIKPGSYEIYVLGEDGSVVKQIFTIQQGQASNLEILLTTNSNSDALTDTNPSTVLQNQASYFPYETAEYKIEATLDYSDIKNPKVASYVITVSHRFFSPSDSEYAQEREAAVESAKQWLSDKGLPTDLPITIIE